MTDIKAQLDNYRRVCPGVDDETLLGFVENGTPTEVAQDVVTKSLKHRVETLEDEADAVREQLRRKNQHIVMVARSQGCQDVTFIEELYGDDPELAEQVKQAFEAVDAA